MPETEKTSTLRLPYSTEAEMAVLGSVILDNDLIGEVNDIIRDPEMFASVPHQKIWKAILELYLDRKTVDLLVLRDWLHKNPALRSEINVDYLLSLVEGVPNVASCLTHAETVRDKWTLRNVMRCCQGIMQFALQNESAKEVRDEAERLLFTAISKFESKKVRSVVEIMHDVFVNIQDIHDRKARLLGLSTGYFELDDMLSGLQKGQLYVIAGRPSMGKTSLAMNIAEKCALGSEKSVLFYSLEMQAEQIAQSLLTSHARIDSSLLRNGKLSDEQFQQLILAAGTFNETRMLIDDDGDLSALDIRTRSRRQKAKANIDLIIVDYLQKMHAGYEKRGPDSRQHEISIISSNLKSLAKELDIPVIAVAQLNRAPEGREDRRPMLSDLRECVHEDTLLVLESGALMPIAKSVPGQRIMGLDKDQKVVPGVIERVWSTGKKQAFQLTLRSGRSITATSNHPFFTEDGWKKLADLKKGTRLAVAFTIPCLKTVSQDADCRLIGYLAGNGSVQKHRTIGLIIPDHDAFSDACSIVRKKWPGLKINLRSNGYNDAWFSFTYENGWGKPHGNPMINWLREIGFGDMRDRTKSVPGFVFEAGASGAAQFLAGYLATDGCVKRTKAGAWAIHFDTTARGLAEDVVILLSRIGVFASIDKGQWNTKSTVPIYRVSLSREYANLLKFSKSVKAMGYRRDLLSMIECETPRETRTGNFALPIPVSVLASQCTGWRHQGKRISRRRCAELALESGSQELERWSESDVVWDGINSIADAGLASTWDIRVGGIHTFLTGNGIVAHNSGAIEQDADVVMLLYREDYYNPNTENKGTAEVIVAKNRTGPTGTVELAFIKQYTRFENLAMNPSS